MCDIDNMSAGSWSVDFKHVPGFTCSAPWFQNIMTPHMFTYQLLILLFCSYTRFFFPKKIERCPDFLFHFTELWDHVTVYQTNANPLWFPKIPSFFVLPLLHCMFSLHGYKVLVHGGYGRSAATYVPISSIEFSLPLVFPCSAFYHCVTCLCAACIYILTSYYEIWQLLQP